MMTKRRSPSLFLTALAALALTGCTGRGGGESSPESQFTPAPATTGSGTRVYFDMRDPKGDDKGGGRYEYPTSFQGRFGFLDITRFRATDAGRFVAFEIEFRRSIGRTRRDGTTEAKNFWLQLVDIYIDQDGRPESGYQWSLPGRNVVFDERSGWEKMVLVTPGYSRDVVEMLRHRSSEPELMRARYHVLVPERVYPQGYSLKVMVPKDQLGGEPQPHWGYQVFAMGYDPENLAYKQLQNMQVQRFAGEESFGGGNDYQGDPNVIDLLAPSKQEQFRWLSNYASRQYRQANRYAVVPMLRAEAVGAGSMAAAGLAPGSGVATAGPVPGSGGAPAPQVSGSVPGLRSAPAPGSTPTRVEPVPPGPGTANSLVLPSRPPSQALPRPPSADLFSSGGASRSASPASSYPTSSSRQPEFSFELDPGVKE